MSALSAVLSVNLRRTSQKIGLQGGFLYGVYRLGNDFDWIPAVK